MTNEPTDEHGWAIETMMLINKLTPSIEGKAFDPDWFLLRERLEEAEKYIESATHIETEAEKKADRFMETRNPNYFPRDDGYAEALEIIRALLLERGIK